MIDRIANEVAIQCMDCGIITDIRQFMEKATNMCFRR